MPVKLTLREKGVNKAVERLRAVGDAAMHQKPTMDDLARDAPSAISRVPVVTGRLAESLTSGSPELYKDVGDFGYDIGTKVYYGRFVFDGTVNMTARKPRIARKRLSDAAANAIAVDIIRARKPLGRLLTFIKQ